jgi:squalene synthase HpnC
VQARAHTENFPVASLVLGSRVRSHLVAIYGFARLADEIGDSFQGDRIVALGWLEDELERCAEGRATHPLLQRLSETVRSCGLPLEPFRRLIEANRRDQVTKRYETFEDLMAYCDLSAAPVGRLVLGVFGADTAERIELSDQVCAGLQVTEHIKDVAEDASVGRIYLPLQDLRRFGCAESQLLARSASDPLRRVVPYRSRAPDTCWIRHSSGEQPCPPRPFGGVRAPTNPVLSLLPGQLRSRTGGEPVASVTLRTFSDRRSASSGRPPWTPYDHLGQAGQSSRDRGGHP